MKRNISSSLTFFSKFILPIFWISSFGLGAIITTVNRRPEAAVFIIAWIVGVVFFYWSCMRLKKVEIDDSSIYFSNYRQVIQVPLLEIAGVTENRWINSHPIWIHLKHPSRFGKSIMFIPKVRLLRWPWATHPIVEELKQLAKCT